MKIGVVQFLAQLGRVDQNVQRANEYVKKAAQQGCRMILFPEMVDTGYEMQTICQLASLWKSSLLLASLQERARDNAIYIVSGLSERVGTDVYNAVAAIDPSGNIVGHYRKIHLFTGAPIHEEQFLKPGSAITVFQADNLSCGIMVCYDLRFPELARLYALNNIQLLLIPSAFPLSHLYHWKILIAARAIENQVFLAAANRVGQDDSVTFGGSSQILDPFGTVLSSASEAGEDLIIADIIAQRITDIRSDFDILRDRRPETYKGL